MRVEESGSISRWNAMNQCVVDSLNIERLLDLGIRG